MNTFIGQFFFVTEYSMFRVTVGDLISSPEVMKVSIRPAGRDLVVPVGGILLGGFYVAITAQGVFKYRMKKHQRAPLDVPPKRIEELSKKGRAMRAFPPIGFFLKYSSAEDCFTQRSTETFDSKWYNDTLTVLNHIGRNHPLITLSTEGEFAIPESLLSHVP